MENRGFIAAAPQSGRHGKFKSPLGNEPSRQTNFLSNLGAPGIQSYWTRLFFFRHALIKSDAGCLHRQTGGPWLECRKIALRYVKVRKALKILAGESREVEAPLALC